MTLLSYIYICFCIIKLRTKYLILVYYFYFINYLFSGSDLACPLRDENLYYLLRPHLKHLEGAPRDRTDVSEVTD